MSKLYFRYSAMGAGKSLDLLKVAYNYKERNKNVLIISSSLDNRFGEGVFGGDWCPDCNKMIDRNQD